jgi:hypothetical protein
MPISSVAFQLLGLLLRHAGLNLRGNAVDGVKGAVAACSICLRILRANGLRAGCYGGWHVTSFP